MLINYHTTNVDSKGHLSSTVFLLLFVCVSCCLIVVLVVVCVCVLLFNCCV